MDLLGATVLIGLGLYSLAWKHDLTMFVACMG